MAFSEGTPSCMTQDKVARSYHWPLAQNNSHFILCCIFLLLSCLSICSKELRNKTLSLWTQSNVDVLSRSINGSTSSPLSIILKCTYYLPLSILFTCYNFWDTPTHLISSRKSIDPNHFSRYRHMGIRLANNMIWEDKSLTCQCTV